MDLTFERDGRVAAVNASGRIDGASAQEFQRAIAANLEDTDRGLILNLGGVTFISSAGLRIVLILAKQTDKQNSPMVLCELSEAVREAFSISGFDKMITIADDEDQARGMM